jgi:hypothetical protein
MVDVRVVIVAATFATIMLVGGLGLLFIGDSLNDGNMISDGWGLILLSVFIYIFDGIIYLASQSSDSD